MINSLEKRRTPFKKEKIDPGDIRKAIYLIDSYRAHLFYDISWIDKRVKEGSLGTPFAAVWKNLRKRLIKMASVTLSIPGLTRLAKIQLIFDALWQISIPLVFILFFTSIFAQKMFFLIKNIAIYLVILAFSSLIAGLLARFLIGREIGKRIDRYFAKNPEAQKLSKEKLREVVQMLINELRRFLCETKEDPRKHLVGVNFLDYKNIKVVKKPAPWRKYYLVEVIVK